jgi:hypothetical protein
MTRLYRFAFRFTFAPITLLAILIIPYAQHGAAKSSADIPISYGKRAETIPTPKTKITLKIRFDNGAIGEVTQFEGETIRYEKNGSVLGIIAYAEEDGINAKVFRIFPGKNEMGILGERIAEVNEFKIGEQAVRVGSGDWGVGVEVLNVEKGSEVKKKLMLPPNQL